MTRSDPRIAELFQAALEQEPPARAEWLARACEGDEDLRREVEELLAEHSEEDEDLETRGSALRELADEILGDPLREGLRVGGFRVLSVLARGGMGTVYEAMQESPPRKVALKVLAAHLEGGEASRRFAHQSGILARLRTQGSPRSSSAAPRMWKAAWSPGSRWSASREPGRSPTSRGRKGSRGTRASACSPRSATRSTTGTARA